jgi:hypothetical protein
MQLGRLNRILESISAHLTLYTAFGIGTAVSVLIAWAAHATEQLKPYAPFSWAFGALVGALFFAALFWLVSKGRSLWISSTITRTFHQIKAPTTNPLEPVFQTQRINISELASPVNRLIANKTFMDCEIIGPANLILAATHPGGGSMNQCNFINCVAVGVRDRGAVPFGLFLQDCTFLRCRLFGVVLFIPRSEQAHFRASMPGFTWITEEPVTDPPIATPPSQEPLASPEEK